MKKKLYRNDSVNLFTIDFDTGDVFHLPEHVKGDVVDGRSDPYRANRVIFGKVDLTVTYGDLSTSMTVDTNSIPNDRIYVGDVYFKNPYDEKARFFCLSYNDKRPVDFTDQPILEEGESYTLTNEGYVAVVQGSITLNETEYTAGTLIKVSNVGAEVIANTKTYLGYIGK